MKHIIIVKAGKGQATVLLDKKQYNDKMNEMLEDNCTYRKLQTDPTSALQRKMNQQLLQLKEEKNSQSLYTRDTYTQWKASRSETVETSKQVLLQ